MTSPVRVFEKYKWLAPLLWMLFGGLGFRVAFPWNDAAAEANRANVRVDTLSVRLDRAIGLLESHIVWAGHKSDSLTQSANAAREAIDSRNRVDCINAFRHHDTYTWNLYISSKINCNALIDGMHR